MNGCCSKQSHLFKVKLMAVCRLLLSAIISSETLYLRNCLFFLSIINTVDHLYSPSVYIRDALMCDSI